MQVTLHITEAILLRSSTCRKDLRHENCAIAEVVREIFPYAIVGNDYIMYYDKHNNQFGKSDLPQIAKNFIQSFDFATQEERVHMKPISFDINIPDYALQCIDIQHVTETINNSLVLEMAH